MMKKSKKILSGLPFLLPHNHHLSLFSSFLLSLSLTLQKLSSIAIHNFYFISLIVSVTLLHRSWKKLNKIKMKNERKWGMNESGSVSLSPEILIRLLCRKYDTNLMKFLRVYSLPTPTQIISNILLFAYLPLITFLQPLSSPSYTYFIYSFKQRNHHFTLLIRFFMDYNFLSF